jgi:hypothetical protein
LTRERKNYISDIFAKLGMSRRTQVAALAALAAQLQAGSRKRHE